jgi:hypothetical protein
LGTVYRSGSVVSHLSIFFRKPKLSILLKAEAWLGLYVCQQTGEISTFLIVITIFVIYACTFGISDFIRSRSIKIGQLRGVELLTDEEYEKIRQNRDAKYIEKNRISSLIHLVLFVVVPAIFWSMGTDETLNNENMKEESKKTPAVAAPVKEDF